MNVLFVDGVTKSFNRKKVLDDVSFSISPGEVVGFVGRSGAGKSVLIKILIGFYHPDKGYVSINSNSKNPIGYSMQDNALYDQLTVKQNLYYFSEIHKIPRKIKKERVELLINRLNLKEYEKVLLKNLSGGTKKRVDIACALLTDPDLIVFDEPFLGLDPILTDALADFIIALGKMGKAVFVSSHQTDVLDKISTRVMMLKGGKLYPIPKSQMREVY
jgi:ABC-2 type transport system ATP-binding protein